MDDQYFIYEQYLEDNPKTLTELWHVNPDRNIDRVKEELEKQINLGKIYRLGSKYVAESYIRECVFKQIKSGKSPYDTVIDNISLSESCCDFFINQLLMLGLIFLMDNKVCYKVRRDVCFSREALLSFARGRLEPFNVEKILEGLDFPVPQAEHKAFDETYQYCQQQLERLINEGFLQRENQGKYAWRMIKDEKY